LGVCLCHPGYSGPSCEYELKCPKGCSGNGHCQYGRCWCLAGYTGDSCDSPLDLRLRQETLQKEIAAAVVATSGCGGCSMHGLCMSGKCVCEAGYSGSDCSLVVGGYLTHRCPSQCNLNGLCLFGKCFCDPGWNGHACEVPLSMACPSDCNQKGFCHYGKCFCNPGVTGNACETEIDCTTSCGAHGVCSSGRCVCANGFAGEHCDIALNSFVAINSEVGSSFKEVFTKEESSLIEMPSVDPGTIVLSSLNFPPAALILMAFLVGVVTSTFVKFLYDKRAQMNRQEGILRPLLEVHHPTNQ